MNFFSNFVKILNKDYMYEISLNIFMGIEAKFTVYFVTFK